MSFEDERLQQIANEYIDALNLSLDALKYVTADYFTFDAKWAEAYETRTILMTELLTNYDVKVDASNERTAEAFYTDAEVFEEKNELEDQLRGCLGKMSFKVIEDSYGWKTYEGYFTNETTYTLKNLQIEVLFYDADGVIIERNYAFGADVLEPGQKARYEFDSDQKYDSMETESALFR